MAKNFALTGAAGYIAPKHLKAIKDTQNRLVVALDPHDSVGILDRYFPDCSFFIEFERFDRHIEKLRRGPAENKVDYISICSPNYLHDAHIRLALRVGAHAICEKPLVIKPWNLDALDELRMETGGKISTIFQLRAHQQLINLRQRVQESLPSRSTVLVTYISARGNWYQHSWKGNFEQSGGIILNIGIHFFDLLIWLFGGVETNIVHLLEDERASGYLGLAHADVRWFLSINKEDLPNKQIRENDRVFKSILVDEVDVNLSEGFTDLHTAVYKKILSGEDYGIETVRPSLQLAHEIQKSQAVKNDNRKHPFLTALINNQEVNNELLYP